MKILFYSESNKMNIGFLPSENHVSELPESDCKTPDIGQTIIITNMN